MNQSQKIQYITDENGQSTAVVIPLENYEATLEDIRDLASIAESKDRGTMSLEELKVA